MFNALSTHPSKSARQNTWAYNSTIQLNALTLLEPPGFGDFRKKKQQFSVALPTP